MESCQQLERANMDLRKAVLTETSFGSRIAEEESEGLEKYFVETEHWRKLLAGEVDIIFGSKGAGKSALYSLLVTQKENLRTGRRTLMLAAENPRGAPAFSDLKNAPLLSEEEFRGLWKLYFLSLAADYIRHNLNVNKIGNVDAAAVIDILTKNKLLAPNITLFSRLKSTLEYLKSYLPSIEGGVTDPNTGLAYTAKITLGEPTSEQRAAGFHSLDSLLSRLNLAYRTVNITVWLALDRLDVAFVDSDDLEGKALRSLFRTYLDMTALTNIKLKIFLRDDIWRKIVDNGFREASHITRTITLDWDRQSLLNLLVRRLAANEEICNYVGALGTDVLSSADLQRDFFYKLFPTQVDKGTSKPKTLDWMLSRTADGSKRTAPRELIHLLISCRDEQLRRHETGNADITHNLLFDKISIRSALPIVSNVRYNQTLCAEYPSLKEYLALLDGAKTQHDLASLGKIWKLGAEQTASIANKLVETGFFERRGTKDTPIFWVPFLYRDALHMIQGSA